MADIIKLVKQQKSIIAAYEKYLDNEEVLNFGIFGVESTHLANCDKKSI